MKRSPLRTYFIISAIASVFLGVIFYFGTHNLQTTFVASGITFIVSVVTIATLELSAKEDSDPKKPRLK